MRQKCLFNFIAALAFLSTCACGDNSDFSKRFPDYRYRLTVEVETPEGLKSGSSVIEVQTAVAGKYTIPVQGQVHHRVRGEGVAVDLGKRGTLFALLRSEYDADWASRALQSVTEPVTYEESKAAGLTADYSPSFGITMKRTLALTGQHDLPRYVDNVITRGTVHNKGETLPSGYPILVTFKDLEDPSSVQKVDDENLAATFGSGVKLRRMTVERTEDDVTWDLDKILPSKFWRASGKIHQHEMQRPGGVLKNPYFRTLHGQLSRNDFISQDDK